MLITMNAHHAEMTLTEDGVITLRNVPFHQGESVEVIVFAIPSANQLESDCPLQGTPVKLIDPTIPVAEADWEAVR